jgi:hypothetical protein
VQRAATADQILAQALRLRDDLELDAARAAIPTLRQGTIAIEGSPGAVVTVAQRSHDFLFGVFEGSPYNGAAFRQAREAGFNLATVLPGWGWSDLAGGKTPAQLDQVLGISALSDLGYAVKVHGAVWLQQYGILPDRARGMAPDEFISANVAQMEGLLGTFGETIAQWEAINEPANVNMIQLQRADVFNLMRQSAEAVRRAGKPALINSGHEADYGNKYEAHTLDGKPVGDYKRTYLHFLEMAREAGVLDTFDTIGLQFYPGAQLNADLGGVQGPAMTPAWLMDTLDRYAAFGKAIHITECSLPSSYNNEWSSGYWREPWSETTQADYAERALTLAFAHPSVASFTWWDITDQKPSVKTGGLINADGTAKAAYSRLAKAIEGWTTHATITLDANGRGSVPAYAGDYDISSGTNIKQTVHVTRQENITVTFEAP